ncbi:AAA family ATPase [Microbacterium ureisolvens]|uniref:AAA family ATPase n=1 Tax=Microbacterium ureisolvens TaxID=2781186 RepID=UPI003637B74F
MSTTRTARRAQPRVKKYKPETVRSAFADWAVGPETDDGEQRMFCPLCEEPGESRTPSASMNPVEGVWNCLKTEEHGGSIYDLVVKLKRERGFDIRGGQTITLPSTRTAVPAKKPKAQPPLEDQAKPLEWHDQLGEHFPERIEWATEQRGVNFDTLRRAHVGFNGTAWTFPARTSTKWLQVKFMQYPKRGDKKVTQTPGARAMLWPAHFLQDEPTLPVLLCEGEWDALLAEQEADGLYVAVTGTGGAGTPPADLSALAKREVFIAYDCDEAGREGAAKVAAKLRDSGANVHVIDLSRLGLPFTQNHGADISDFFRQYGGNAHKLAEEFERLRRVDSDTERDEVLRAIEELFLMEDDPRGSLIESVRSDDDILTMTPGRYVIDGWVPVGFFSDFFGEPGSHKTFVLLDMLRHIRAGMPWHGREVEQGATLLFEGEGLEQLQPRIAAWNEFHDSPSLEPGGSVSDPVDMTTPEGVARVVRTVRDFERRHSTRVVAVAFDPLVEYMNGEENGEGMELATLGLRALARYLDIAVIVGAHTNAAGLRARGGDQLRMRSGAHVRVETLKGGRIGLVQEKQKNGERLALQLMPVRVLDSLALSMYAKQTAAEYYASKSGDDAEERATLKLKLSEESAAVKTSKADELLIGCVTEFPGIGKAKLIDRCAGQGVGKPALGVRVDELEAEGRFRVTRDGTARNAPSHYFLVEPDAESDETS